MVVVVVSVVEAAEESKISKGDFSFGVGSGVTIVVVALDSVRVSVVVEDEGLFKKK